MNHPFKHKPIYNNTDFTLKGNAYTYLEGTYCWFEGELVDAIEFCLKEKPEQHWIRPEKIFFENVDIRNLKINTSLLQ